MALMTKKEIERDILKRCALDSQRKTLVFENLSLEELRKHILPEHSFSSIEIRVGFLSKADRSYQVSFWWDQRSYTSRLYGFDKDHEDFESVVMIVAKEIGGKPPMVKRTEGFFKRTISELEIKEIPEGIIVHGAPANACIYIHIILSSQLTQERVANFVETISEHFRNIKNRITYSGVQIEKIPEKYLRRVYSHVIEEILKEIDEYVDSVRQYGAASTEIGYDEGFSEAEVYPGEWMLKIWAYRGTDEEVLMELRKLREGYVQAMEEMSFLELIREPEEAEKREDRERLDAELEDWAASIDKRDIKEWILKDLKNKGRGSITIFHSESKQKWYIKRILTPETLKENVFGARGSISVEFVSESNIKYGVGIGYGESTDIILQTLSSEHPIKAEDLTEVRRIILRLTGNEIARAQLPEEWCSIAESRLRVLKDKATQSRVADYITHARLQEEDFWRVTKIIAEVMEGKPGYVDRTSYRIAYYGKIIPKDKVTQPKVADYIERFREHFRNVRIESIQFGRARSQKEGTLNEYEKSLAAREILGIFDWAAADLDQERGSGNFYFSLPPFVDRANPRSGPSNITLAKAGPKGVLLIMDEQDLWPPLSFKPSDVKSRYWNNHVYVTREKFRKMKEMYKQVMEGMSIFPYFSLYEVRTAFLNELDALKPKFETLNLNIGIDFFIFEEVEEGRILVRGRGYLERDIWGALNDMVRRELDGRYDPSERGWAIGK